MSSISDYQVEMEKKNKLKSAQIGYSVGIGIILVICIYILPFYYNKNGLKNMKISSRENFLKEFNNTSFPFYLISTIFIICLISFSIAISNINKELEKLHS